MSNPKILSHAQTIESKLHELGLTRSQLQRAVEAGEAARKSTTENHAANAGGTYAYHETVATLRGFLKPEGWKTSNAGNLAASIHPSGLHALVVTGGSKETGLAGFNPTSRNPKGEQTARFIDRNQHQLELLPLPEEEKKEHDLPEHTWVLMYYSDKDKKEVRFELSLPTNIDERSRMSEWRVRLILGSFSSSWDQMENEDVDSDIEFSEEIEFSIPSKT
ncbi:hypothetical protein [Alloalcanivorax venustensis]|uniref:hypothetical protein n=1 Tax=Alloalcanivorax venustensis TaxID=172371 RepID=UPI002EB73EBF|nr:hypothetical protein [Pseudomonadota bacterium]|tara:strand:+ start:62353 stop:63012 length:660 start_codon:yes stop_codon:yes gene_type:complete